MILNNPQPLLFDRGSRILPEHLDRNRYSKTITGAGAVAAQQATASAVGGSLITGAAATAATRAVVVAFGAGVSETLQAFPVGASVITVQRRGRRTVVADYTIYVNVANDTHAGAAGAQAQRVTVSASAIRTISGASVSAAQRASVIGVSAFVSGQASVTAQPTSVSAVGSVRRNILTAAIVAQRATASATGRRIITVVGVPAAQPAAVSAQGETPGLVSGTASLTAQRASVTVLGKRGFSGVGVVEAQRGRAGGFGGPFVPDEPVFNEIPTVLSRVWRDTSYDFNRNLLQGAEPLTFAVTQGALPLGLSLDPDTGIVTGRTLYSAVYYVAVTATNITGSAETNYFRWVVSPSIPKDGIFLNQNVVTVIGL